MDSGGLGTQRDGGIVEVSPQKPVRPLGRSCSDSRLLCLPDLVSNQSAEGLLEDCDLFGPARDDVLAMAVKMANVLDEPGQDLEADFPKSEWDLRRAH